MDKSDSKKLAEEMTEFCKKRIEKSASRSTRSLTFKAVLQGVIASLLTVPATMGGTPDQKSSW